MHQWWIHTWRQAAVQYQWQYLATVYDEAFIQVFTVMVSYLLSSSEKMISVTQYLYCGEEEDYLSDGA